MNIICPGCGKDVENEWHSKSGYCRECAKRIALDEKRGKRLSVRLEQYESDTLKNIWWIQAYLYFALPAITIWYIFSTYLNASMQQHAFVALTAIASACMICNLILFRRLDKIAFAATIAASASVIASKAIGFIMSFAFVRDIESTGSAAIDSIIGTGVYVAAMSSAIPDFIVIAFATVNIVYFFRRKALFEGKYSAQQFIGE